MDEHQNGIKPESRFVRVLRAMLPKRIDAFADYEPETKEAPTTSNAVEKPSDVVPSPAADLRPSRIETPEERRAKMQLVKPPEQPPTQ